MTVPLNNNQDILSYEIQMFYAATKELQKKPRKLENKIKQALFFEAFLIHTRILMEFFLQSDQRSNAIKLTDFTANNLTDTKENQDLINLNSKNNREKLTLKDRIDKCLAHLTQERITYLYKKEWDTKKIAAVIINLIHRFKENNSTIKIKCPTLNLSLLGTYATPYLVEMIRIQEDEKKRNA